jgi:steroid delta-isomerase-like uncharacterized protein
MGDARHVADAGTKAFNAHDEAAIRETWAPGVVYEAPGGVRSVGADAATEYAMAWLRAFPDAKVTVTNQVASGDWVAEEFTFQGTHKETLSGPGGDIPATGRQITGRGTQLLRVEDDKVAEFRIYFDQVELLTQLGLMPEPATA